MASVKSSAGGDRTRSREDVVEISLRSLSSFVASLVAAMPRCALLCFFAAIGRFGIRLLTRAARSVRDGIGSRGR